jgi:enoyl-CoA hydratase/carnithine racemase
MADSRGATDPPELLAVRRDKVLTLVLNRPSVLNAFSGEQYRRFADALGAAQDDPAVSVVVVTGAGRAFSSGVDLHELAARTAEDDGRPDFERFVDALSTFAKPLLCAVNGLAVGVGATMLGLADLVLMSEDARIQLPFAARSMLPEAGSTFTLQRLLGPQQAAWAMLSGSWLSAADCLAVGLAWRVFPGDDLLTETRVRAETIAAHPVETLIEIKALLRATSATFTGQARERESRAHARWSSALCATPQ